MGSRLRAISFKQALKNLKRLAFLVCVLMLLHCLVDFGFSPRFASIMPDKADVRGSLSPSILSFYKDDTEDQLLPIPKVISEEPAETSHTERQLTIKSKNKFRGRIKA